MHTVFGDARNLMGNASNIGGCDGALTAIGVLYNECDVLRVLPFCCTNARVAYVRGMLPKINSRREIGGVPSISRRPWSNMGVSFNSVFRHFAGRCAQRLRKVAKGCANTLVSITRRKPRYIRRRSHAYRSRRSRVRRTIAISSCSCR